jgi:hypothetical protein
MIRELQLQVMTVVQEEAEKVYPIKATPMTVMVYWMNTVMNI